MYDVEAPNMSLDVDQLANSADVVTSSDEGQVSGLIDEVLLDDILFEVQLNGVSDVDIGVGISDSSGIAGDDVGNLVGSNSSGSDFNEFELGFSFLDFV